MLVGMSYRVLHQGIRAGPLPAASLPHCMMRMASPHERGGLGSDVGQAGCCNETPKHVCTYSRTSLMRSRTSSYEGASTIA